MKQLLFTCSIFIIFLFTCCSSKDKIDVSSIEIDGDLTVEHNPSFTIDSIIIFNTGSIIKSTGDTIYSITTKAEKERVDSLREAQKNQPANPLAQPTTRQTFTLNENSYFSIIVYDTLGNEVIKLIDDKFPKGKYEVYYAIYSILQPGSYILAMSSQLVEQYIKLKVN